MNSLVNVVRSFLAIVAAGCLAMVCHAQPAPGPVTPIKAVPSPASFSDRLTAVELALSTIVAEEPRLWKFELLEGEASALLVDASSETDRQAVRELSERIERFAQLADRHRQLGHTPAPFRLTKARSATDLGVTQPANIKTNKEYDAVGMLKPVVSKRANAPKFALVDERGKVTTFVTPSPEIDLQPLVGKRIGIRGTRGFMPEYKKDHLVATRATPLKMVR